MRKRVDLGVIAEKVGVSKTTVHYALHQPQRLGDETLQRVLAAVDELGYRPNLLARSLRLQRSFTIGVVTTVLGGFFDNIFWGMEEAAEADQYTALIAPSLTRPAKERELVEMFLERAVDGLIVFPVESDENAAFYRNLQAEQVPFVFAEHAVPGVDADLAGTDSLLGGRMAARHLLAQGRTRIAFLTSPPNRRHYRWVRARLAGCNMALQAAGRQPALEIGQETSLETEYFEFGYEAVRSELAGGLTFDGLFAANDALAYGAMKALKEVGYEVGDDISVVGFDDSDPSAYLTPPLTTLRHPSREIGREAVRLLLKRIDDPAEEGTQQALFRPTLIVRKS